MKCVLGEKPGVKKGDTLPTLLRIVSVDKTERNSAPLSKNGSPSLTGTT